MFSPNLPLPRGPVVRVLPYFSKKTGKYHARRKGNGVSLESLSVTHSENLRMESLLQGWKPVCFKWLMFLSLSTAPSFLSVNIFWGRWCCRSTITWDLRDLDSLSLEFVWSLASYLKCLCFYSHLHSLACAHRTSFLPFFISPVCALITCWQMVFFTMCWCVA